MQLTLIEALISTFDCNKHDEVPLTCDAIQTCPIFKRLLNILMDSAAMPSVVDILNDYLHLLHSHDTDREFEYMSNTLGFCNIMICDIYTRNNNQTLKQQYDSSVITNNFLDKIHCYFFHTYDIGLRLTCQEQTMIHNESQINDEKMNESHINFNRNALNIMRKIITNKRKKYHNILSNLDTRHNLKCKQLLNPNSNSPSNSKHKFQKYAFGYKFGYGFEDDEEGIETVITVQEKYDSLKEELTSNKICTINMEQFNHEYGKAQIHINSRYCKHKFVVHGNEYIALNHILTLMFYCNYTQLQYEFSKTFRTPTKEWEIEDHEAEYYHFGLNLIFAIHVYGTEYGKEINRLYHGVSELLRFPKCVDDVGNDVNIYCPLSTTSSQIIAFDFANQTEGMVLEFNPSKERGKFHWVGKANCFSVSWLSDFPAEKEYVFFQNEGKIEIVNIWDIKNNIEYDIIIKALRCINIMTITDDSRLNDIDIQIDSNLKDLIIAVIHHQLSLVDKEYSEFKSLTPYAVQLIKTYFRNKHTMLLDHKIMMNPKFSLLSDVLWDTKHQWVKLQNVINLFPNVTGIQIASIRLTDFVLLDILQFLQNGVTAHKLDEIIIYFEGITASLSSVKDTFMNEVGWETKILFLNYSTQHAIGHDPDTSGEARFIKDVGTENAMKQKKRPERLMKKNNIKENEIPVCKCGDKMILITANDAQREYAENYLEPNSESDSNESVVEELGIICNGCDNEFSGDIIVWHCDYGYGDKMHKKGYDLCIVCGAKRRCGELIDEEVGESEYETTEFENDDFDTDEYYDDEDYEDKSSVY